jgi:hypothetical protein
MLDSFIIDELRRRETERRPALQIPIRDPPRRRTDEQDDEPDDVPRGVVVIDL